ncbi:hydantoinase/oxoprolinase family protein [Pseudomonas fluorescens]|uniref:Acetophenone carboxylase gamma subunit n=1 Tax=Pseudomonas fluorescens TaxID=294 RepID=A0A5E7BGH4_PSEFL|nr:hydantoinase/oxoprolinase family protein [Pseudomonas fluorescens]VVN84591.1 Acetophenone carboxylase gamma subunit [Pseudomonas fluorescens]
MTKQQYRLGIDAGGTFTDFILADRNGNVQLFKAPSTPQDGTIAIRNGLAQIADAIGRTPAQIIADCDLCINGTTVALNALIEKTGVKVGLLCTDGHEDSLEIRLGHKEDGHRYDANYPPAHMLVPRHLRRPIGGRIISDGSQYCPLDETAIRAAIDYFREQDVKAVAISFVWSVRNPSHEQRAAEMVRAALPGVFVCTGNEVFPQIREYTRTSTTVVNAYLSPVMGRYIERIDALFEELGAQQPTRYFQSNGGLAPGAIMRERAVNAINSGPASAPQAGLCVAKPFGIDNVITVDMGGTSFDITLSKSGRTNFSKDSDFLRYRIGVPMIQVETLGAGGGSIAHLDAFGMLQVGPRSAGASPGPVCYGKGGVEPTVTDANLALGYLADGALLGGSIRLNRQAAIDAIGKKIAEPLGISVERAALGIITLVNLNMVSGIRRVSVERGYDPREFALIGAGGAAGMHVIRLAEEIGSQVVLIPKVASGLCAFGQILSDIRYDQLTTLPMRLDDPFVNLPLLNQTLNELRERGMNNLREDGFSAGNKVDCLYSLEIRYLGQIHECSIELTQAPLDNAGLVALREAFHTRHKALFSYSEPQSPIELVNLECSVIARLQHPPMPELPIPENAQPAVPQSHRSMLFDGIDTWQETPVYNGDRLQVGQTISGPCVIEEATTNIVVPPGWQACLAPSATYRLTPGN